MSENLLAKYAKSFNWAGFFLPSKEYEKSLIVYNFCRTLDDIADENRNLDISKEMLSIGKQKVLSRNLNNRIKMLSGDSEDLNFNDESFDIVTISFGIRNLENIEKGLNEIKRVLKSKGTLVILETSVPKNIIVKSLYLLYVRCIIPLISFILFTGCEQYTSKKTSKLNLKPEKISFREQIHVFKNASFML